MREKTKRTPVTADEIVDRLRRRYSPPEWIFLAEVPDSTGFDSKRRADGVAVSTWPSEGLEIHGFEVKVSRADFLRELRLPGVPRDKWIAVGRHCDRWWLVVSDRTIVREGELPPQWGLMVASGDGLRAHVQAPSMRYLGESSEREPVDRGFVASLVRAAFKATDPFAEWRYKNKLEFQVAMSFVDLGVSIREFARRAAA